MSMNPPTAPASKGPNWMLIGTGAAVVLGVITLLSKNSGGGTTAAGTSINAALGSLQEEQMNTQGQIGLMQQSLGLGPNETLTGHIDANQAATLGAISDVNTQVAGVGSQLNTQISGVQTALSGQVAQVGGQVSDLSKQSATQASTASTQNVNFFNQLMGALAGLFGGQQQIQSGIGTLQSGQSQIITQGALTDIHNQINFNAVQAALNGNPNPIMAQQLMAATSGTY